MITIYLGGELGRLFGRKWKLHVGSTAEALRLIEANKPGLMAYLAGSGDRGIDFRVRVNGETIGENKLALKRPGSVIRISPVVRGSKSKYFGIILGIVLIVVAWWNPGGWAGATYLFGSAATGGLSVAALVGGIGISLALGGVAALLSPQPKTSAGDTGGPSSKVFNGPQNLSQNGTPVPLCYGGPLIIGSSRISAGVYTEQLAAKLLPKNDDLPGPDPAGEGGFTVDPSLSAYSYVGTESKLLARDLQTLQVYRILDLLCEGQIAGLCDEAGNILTYNERLRGTFFDRTPARGPDGKLAFSKFATAFRNGTVSQSWMAGFPATEQEVSVNAEIIHGDDKLANAVQRQIQSGDYNAVRIQIQVPSIYRYDSQGNRTGSQIHLTIQAKKSTESVWMEMVGSATAYDEMDGLIIGESLGEVRYSYRLPLDGAFTWDVRIIRETDDSADISKLQNRSIWSEYTLINDTKLRYPHSVISGTELSAEKFQNVPEMSWRVKGKLLKVPSNYNPDTRNYSGVWDGSFAGCSIVLTSAYTLGQTVLSVAPLAAFLPDNSPVEITVGLFKSEAYLIGDHPAGSTTLSITPIPRNISTGAEGFGFHLKWTNNPAWIFYDIIHHKRYGLGAYVPADRIDTAALYTIARYCDGVDNDGNYVGVDDGNGGIEPRFACNCYIGSSDEAYKVLQDLASAFRGLVFWSTGLISAVQDAPKSPVFQFTDANVIDGMFNYSGSSRKSIHTVALVAFNNPDLFFAQDIETYEDNAMIERFGVRNSRVTAFGCTSRSQAHRIGKWILETEKLETQTVTFRAPLEAARVNLGDLIQVRDRYKSINRMGGRIHAVDPGVIVVDSDIVLTADAHTIMVSLADGGVRELSVTNGAGTFRLLNVTGDLTGVLPEAVWILRNDNVEPFVARVIELKELEKHTFEITAVEYVAGKFASVESNIDVVEPPTSDLPNTAVPLGVTSLTVAERAIITPSGSQRQIYASWSPSPSPYVLGYRVEIKAPGGSWAQLGDVSMAISTVGIPVTIQGEYAFRVFTVGYYSVESAATVVTYTVGDVSAPSAPTSFTADGKPEAVSLDWINPNDIDLMAIEVWTGLTTNLSLATRIQVAFVSHYNHTNLTAGLPRFYWIRAVNRSGVYSAFVGPVTATPETGLASVVTSLNSKNTVFRQATAPTPYAIGDTWFDSDDGNKIYRWDGISWVDAQRDLDVSDFGTGVRPIEIVNALPSADNFKGRTVFLKTDSKLYRWTDAVASIGTTYWSKAVDGADLITGSILAGAIAAGAVTADKVGANQVITLAANIADAVITGAKIANAAIGTALIADLAVSQGKIANLAVDTLKLANQAVTIPVSSYTAGAMTCLVGTLNILQQATIISTGAPIFINFSFVNISGSPYNTHFNFFIYRGATLIYEVNDVGYEGAQYNVSGDRISTPVMKSGAFLDTPGQGTFTYYLKLTAGENSSALNRSLLLLETKK